MPEPTLYHDYDRHEAIALFGSEAEARSLCDGQWLIFPNVIVCLATLGDWPSMSHFKTSSRFCWVADKPYRTGFNGAVPTEILSGKTGGRTIRLFARKKNGERFIFLGELAPAYSHGYKGKHNFGNADLGLSPTLASRVWIDLGGLGPGNVDHPAVDAALDRLRKPTTSEDRLGILRRLVEYWHGAIHPGDGFSEDELQHVRMPSVLKRWYGWAGRRKEIMSGQNFLKEPQGLKLLDDGRLLFYVENQGVYLWSTSADGTDPPVYGRFNEEGIPWTEEGVTFSEFLIGVCLFEAIMQAPYGASAAWATKETVTKIVAVLPPLALTPWRWPSDTSRFFGHNGAFMFVAPNGEAHYSIWVGATTEAPLQFMKEVTDESWEYVSF